MTVSQFHAVRSNRDVDENFRRQRVAFQLLLEFAVRGFRRGDAFGGNGVAK
jgi:hypothetical protein